MVGLTPPYTTTKCEGVKSKLSPGLQHFENLVAGFVTADTAR